MDDLISREKAIEAIDKIFPADPMRNDYTQGITCGAALATEYIKQLPSAQPEKRTEKRTETHARDCISRQAAIDARRYTFGNDEFSLEAAYHDCKLVFDGIVDDDSFQEADTGLILYYANEIIYALSEAIKAVSAQSEQPEIVRCKDCKYLLPKGSFCSKDMCGLRGMAHYCHVDIHNDFCSWAERREE